MYYKYLVKEKYDFIISFYKFLGNKSWIPKRTKPIMSFHSNETFSIKVYCIVIGLHQNKDESRQILNTNLSNLELSRL